MTSTSENPYGTPTTTGPEPLRPYQHRVNGFVRGLLKVPVLSGIVGKRLATLHVTGRKSGTVYDVPVAYTVHQDSLLVGTALRPWVKNLRGGAEVRLTRGGAPETFTATVHSDEQAVLELYAVIARDNKQNAKFNGIGYTADGEPSKADIYQTWQQGGVVVELTPR
ncbi:nitroreductase/quinone reductase family protein [Nocardia neocaledoniensis]|uniref:nitroreductase/quinone reductase family protein n=1 Tax=Nocardia neocaledoniensis TaxID=236511 RepID=UPI0024560C75|nr:nitroreductase/quinone reductase family protein [Nocardia neocaledoniensis]